MNYAMVKKRQQLLQENANLRRLLELSRKECEEKTTLVRGLEENLTSWMNRAIAAETDLSACVCNLASINEPTELIVALAERLQRELEETNNRFANHQIDLEERDSAAFASIADVLQDAYDAPKGLRCATCGGNGFGKAQGADEFGPGPCDDCDGHGYITDGYLIADFRNPGHGGEVLWWGPSSCGYYVDIDRAGVYAKDQVERICKGYEYLIPVPVRMLLGSYLRRTVQCYDKGNGRYGTSDKLRAAVAEFEKEVLTSDTAVVE